MGRKKDINKNQEVLIEIQDTINNDSLDLLNDVDVVIENVFESEVNEDGKEN